MKIDRRRSSILVTICLAANCVFNNQAIAEKPNIVLILADDLGYGDLGCYGNKVNKTPHIDALASRGLRFTDFHSAGAMCSPTRASILTGLYPHRFGAEFDGALGGVSHKDLGLPLKAVTIAELLRNHGYATGCFGKWHLGYNAPFLPTRQGFDVFRGLVSGDGDFHTQIDRSGNEDWWHNEKRVNEQGYTTDLLTKHSLNFIKSNRGKPFFLYLPHLAIHFPWQGPNDPPHRTAGKSWHKDKWGVIPDRSNVAPHVKAMIESLDASVGAIVSALRKWKLEENTIIVFTSDNGGYLTYRPDFRNISSNGPWRGQKVQLYEGGHRVPTIVVWPGRIATGVTHQTTHSNDLFPTFLRITGATPTVSDGIDLSPLWLEGQPLPERNLFWRSRSHRAVRHGQWKLFAPRRKDADIELYHLEDDRAESVNLASKEPDVVRRLSTAWDDWQTDVSRTAKEYSQ